MLSAATQAALRSNLPTGAAVANPVGLIASAGADAYGMALDLLLSGDEVDAVVAIFTPPLGTEADDVARAVVQAVEAAEGAGRTAKTVVTSFLGSAQDRGALSAGSRRIPTFTYPETAVRALAGAVSYSRWRAKAPGQVPVLEGIGANAARRLIERGADGTEWLTGAQAMAMVHGLHGTPLLTGYRGSRPVDLDALADLIVRLGQLADDLPELAEVDCNPVVATPGGALVLDARIRLHPDQRAVDKRRRLL